jgi:DNA-binding NtrC family response regulator
MSVLIIDDDPNVSKVMENILTEGEYEVATAYSVDESIHKLQADSSIEVVILDIVMPGGDGFDFLKFLTSNLRFRHIPVIMCSGYADAPNLERSILSGAKDFIAKPVRPDILLAKVKSVLERARKTILVVMEDTQLLGILSRMVEREGFNAVSKQTGADALTHIDKHTVDAVISQIEMSEMSGWDLLIEVKERDFQLPILLIQDSTRQTDVDPLAAGADGLISLPFENITVRRTLQELFTKVEEATL